MKLTWLDKEIIRELQGDINLEPQPYLSIALRLGVSEEEVLERIKILKDNGFIRRFGATLQHRNIGLKANAMVVWRISDDAIDNIGRIIASLPQVTHCYKRTPAPGFPYNLFAMIHGKTREECRGVVVQISRDLGLKVHEILFSSRELKKTSMKYF